MEVIKKGSNESEITKLNREIAKLKSVVEQNRRMATQIAGLTRVSNVLSKTYEALVQLPELNQLFQRVCRIAVEDGDFRMAWVGMARPETLSVQPVACWGIEKGYLEEIRISTTDVAEGRGPVGVAIREGRFCICTDIEHDPRMAPWRDRALKRGYRSAGAFPLIVRSETIGAIVFYASEADFFSAEILQLLKSLAAILS